MFERFTKNAKMAVVVAQEEARQLRAPEIRVEHVLLGVLSQAEPAMKDMLAAAGLTHDGVAASLAEEGKNEPLGDRDAEALRSIGIDLDAVRDSLEATFGEDALELAEPPEPRGFFGRGRGSNFGHIRFSRDAKKVLELALREALARKDNGIESGHILLGILRAPNATTTALVGGPESVDSLRTRAHALLDQAA
ncbi:Clp protease [Nocardia cyriacigeorgica]|uniref:Clp protease n=1 Tax=Nocardia cyriacigeorgica TaxID=135487 RepID=A0A6P1DFG2_9NOCA|nr:Clp protease N-terminal domain-containing protein [Nocardia cyriacigeorgica]NEW39462.1 Clp protease [Nocardia cyriacigeorgica]NEW47162.1 Clp protease [Nocardia cyriacigeorgica]NEW53791.1 Clp protease [Nocardia cyriacigeorgica]NEW58893.1 Clp protease [Nocardia cyriacigeorgica]